MGFSALENPGANEPLVVSLFRPGVSNVFSLIDELLDRRLPAVFGNDFLAGQEIDRFLPSGPEGTELSGLLPFDEEVDDAIRFLLGHVRRIRNLSDPFPFR